MNDKVTRESVKAAQAAILKLDGTDLAGLLIDEQPTDWLGMNPLPADTTKAHAFLVRIALGLVDHVTERGEFPGVADIEKLDMLPEPEIQDAWLIFHELDLWNTNSCESYRGREMAPKVMRDMAHSLTHLLIKLYDPEV